MDGLSVLGYRIRALIKFFQKLQSQQARLHAAYYRIGGVHQDIPKKVLEDIFNWSNKFGKVIEDIENLLDNNRIFKQRTVNVGVVSKKQALDWGFTGPMLRGSGVIWDLRKAQTLCSL